MSGIYIHIPFCKQACHYCDFHFSTSLKKKEEMVAALITELILRKSEFAQEIIETIYFGGGTPSLLSDLEIETILKTIYQNYQVAEYPEITLEANPDDLTESRILSLSKSRINRLSIGIQSFFDEDLQLMNRAHHSMDSIRCLELASQHFDNISIDLIYGIPNMSQERWVKNIEIALSFNIPHLSCYALTVEPKTALQKLIQTGKIDAPQDEIAEIHFLKLIEILESNGFIHYETSNFGKENYFSRNNSAYWKGKKYIGIGPSAHSFSGTQRSWNISNNPIYIKNIAQNILPSETETLTIADKYNEYIMTGLRTIWGIDVLHIDQQFGEFYVNYLKVQLLSLSNKSYINQTDTTIKVTTEGRFYTDGIASHLFYTK